MESQAFQEEKVTCIPHDQSLGTTPPLSINLAYWAQCRRQRLSPNPQPHFAQYSRWKMQNPSPQRPLSSVEPDSSTLSPSQKEVHVQITELSSLERKALLDLQSYGAFKASPQELTENQVKKEFRRLAKDLHPDHHQERDELTRERLNRQFATAYEAYQDLLEAFVRKAA